eukprot:400548-Pyramimonas_sp.AAC.1
MLGKGKIYGPTLDISHNGPYVSAQIPFRGRGPFWANIWHAENKINEHAGLTFAVPLHCRTVRD